MDMVSATVTTVEGSVVGGERVMVRTQQPQILRPIVPPIAGPIQKQAAV